VEEERKAQDWWRGKKIAQWILRKFRSKARGNNNNLFGTSYLPFLCEDVELYAYAATQE
jgi:hypothetical protein